MKYKEVIEINNFLSQVDKDIDLIVDHMMINKTEEKKLENVMDVIIFLQYKITEIRQTKYTLMNDDYSKNHTENRIKIFYRTITDLKQYINSEINRMKEILEIERGI